MDSNGQPHSVIKSQHSGLFPEPFPEPEKDSYSNGAENHHEHGSNGNDKKPLIPPTFPPYAMPSPYGYYHYPPMVPSYYPPSYGMPPMGPMSPFAPSYPASPYAQPYRSPMAYPSYDLSKPNEPTSASSATDAYPPSPQPSRPSSASHAPYSPAQPYGYPPHLPYPSYSREHTPQKQRQPVPFNPKQDGV